MKLIMDADCLIKLAKSHLKEDTCTAFEVSIPATVRREVMVNASDHPECTIVRRNLDNGKLQEVASPKRHAKGEDAVVATYEKGQYAAIASDDRRFIKKLRLLGVPYLTPAVLVLLLVKHEHLTVEEGFTRLAALSPMVSDAETAIVKAKLGAMKDRED